VKTLVEKSVHAFSGRVSQGHAKVVIQRFQVSRLKALENDFVPHDVGLEQVELFAGRAAVMDFKIINDVETFW
jgi:hypothetical protein